jgi:hypothetical protein
MTVTMLDALPNAFSYSVAHERGLSDRRLKAYVEDGVLERLGHGVYRKADAPPADLDRIEIALRAPDAALCLTSALSVHDLTDTIPSAIDIALPRSRRPPRVSAPVRWHRFHEDTFLVGRETIEVDEGVALGLYNAERCIIDAFRLGHREGHGTRRGGAEALAPATRGFARRAPRDGATLPQGRAVPPAGPQDPLVKPKPTHADLAGARPTSRCSASLARRSGLPPSCSSSTSSRASSAGSSAHDMTSGSC